MQLPTFSFVTVTTTVSVPDGGTVLLGGIKRLSEGRNEFGVPLLEQAALHQPAVQERRHRPRNAKPDDDGHAANHHPGRGRREAGHPAAAVATVVAGIRGTCAATIETRANALPVPSPAYPPQAGDGRFFGVARKQVSPFAPRKSRSFAERKATFRQLLIRRSLRRLHRKQLC